MLKQLAKAVFWRDVGERSGSEAFVSVPSSCFLRKALWPVCVCASGSVSSHCFYWNTVPPNCSYLLHVAQPLPKRAFLTFETLPFVSAHHLSCGPHMVELPWASTRQSERRAGAPPSHTRITTGRLSTSPVIVVPVLKWRCLVELKGRCISEEFPLTLFFCLWRLDGSSLTDMFGHTNLPSNQIF